jgi:predicted transcriptional regulator of viral defense system
MNWTTILAEEARTNSILRLDDLAKRRNISEPIVRTALSRCQSRGLVEHVSKGIYINKLNQQFSPRDLANALRPDSYISLESALVEHGIRSQRPAVLTCVTTGYPKMFRRRSVTIVYRKVATSLFWGFEEKLTRYSKYRIAEPEKALLDWIYLNRQEGLPTPLDELNLEFLNLEKLRAYAGRYPSTVKRDVERLLLDHVVAPD